LVDSTLDLLINLDKATTSFVGKDIKDQLSILLGLPLRLALGNAEVQLRGMTGALQNILSRKNRVLVKLDFSFMESQEFLTETETNQLLMIKSLLGHANRLLINGMFQFLPSTLF
jgi:hypothetical protein